MAGSREGRGDAGIPSGRPGEAPLGQGVGASKSSPVAGCSVEPAHEEGWGGGQLRGHCRASRPPAGGGTGLCRAFPWPQWLPSSLEKHQATSFPSPKVTFSLKLTL